MQVCTSEKVFSCMKIQYLINTSVFRILQWVGTDFRRFIRRCTYSMDSIPAPYHQRQIRAVFDLHDPHTQLRTVADMTIIALTKLLGRSWVRRWIAYPLCWSIYKNELPESFVLAVSVFTWFVVVVVVVVVVKAYWKQWLISRLILRSILRSVYPLILFNHPFSLFIHPFRLLSKGSSKISIKKNWSMLASSFGHFTPVPVE